MSSCVQKRFVNDSFDEFTLSTASEAKVHFPPIPLKKAA